MYKKRINMIQNLEETAVMVPNKIAVIDGERSISFQNLRSFSRNIGYAVTNAMSKQIRRPIGVYIEKSIESISADLGILYSGNYYLNLDVKTPNMRTLNIIQLVDPAFIITRKEYKDKLEAIYSAEKLLFIDDFSLSESLFEDSSLDIQWNSTIDSDPMCVLTTSGSTGTPKGVVLTHRGFFDYVSWAIEATGLKTDEIFASLAPIGFDHFSFELCFMITSGSTFTIIPDSYAAFPVKLLQYMKELHVTYIFWVPTIMTNIANNDLLSKIPQKDLRMVWFAGEVLPTKIYNYWKRNLPNKTCFVNLYGPTEITVDCTFHIIDRELDDDEPIPIGKACRNTDVLILNEEDKLCGVGEEGELCVRGSSLAMGYYNNPDKTAAAFVQNPLNHAYPELIYRTGDIAMVNERGEIMYKGRRDTLVKHSGYRIELAEIEHVVINNLKLIKNGCVVYDYAHKEIVLFYENDQEISLHDFRSSIGASLPRYMVPSRYIKLPEMPRNANGKIDRLQLKEQVQK